MRKKQEDNKSKGKTKPNAKCPAKLGSIIQLCNLVDIDTDLENENVVLNRLEKEFLSGIADKSQLTHSSMTPLWIKVFYKCYENFPDSYTAQIAPLLERYIKATTEKDCEGINRDLIFLIFKHYRSIRMDREYLLPIVKKIDERRTGRYSHGEPIPIDFWEREMDFAVAELPPPKLRAYFTDNGTIEIRLSKISEFAEAINGIEFDRLRICEFCRRKFFWASRLDKTA